MKAILLDRLYFYLPISKASERLGDLARDANDISLNDIRAEILEIKNLLDEL